VSTELVIIVRQLLKCSHGDKPSFARLLLSSDNT
jgi:hypothetical protein